MPTLERQNVTYERALLLYAIMEGQTINAGELIRDQIKRCHEDKAGYLWFPSFVTNLCTRYGLPFPTTDTLIKVDLTVDDVTFNTIFDWPKPQAKVGEVYAAEAVTKKELDMDEIISRLAKIEG